MSQCWREGDWRAYIDGELPVEAMVEGRTHLAACADCARLHAELAARASRIGALMMELDRTPAASRHPVRPAAGWKWAAGAVALAAALAAFFVLAPARVEAPTVAEIPAVSKPVVPAAPPAPVAPATVAASIPARKDVRPVRAARARRLRAPQPQYFLAFDDEPIDTGTVMRVTLQSGIEADVIVDSGGRPRAIRTVQAIRY